MSGYPQDAFILVSADNLDFIHGHATVNCGKQQRSWHGTRVQVVQPRPSCLIDTCSQTETHAETTTNSESSYQEREPHSPPSSTSEIRLSKRLHSSCSPLSKSCSPSKHSLFPKWLRRMRTGWSATTGSPTTRSPTTRSVTTKSAITRSATPGWAFCCFAPSVACGLFCSLKNLVIPGWLGSCGQWGGGVSCFPPGAIDVVNTDWYTNAIVVCATPVVEMFCCTPFRAVLSGRVHHKTSLDTPCRCLVYNCLVL